MGKEAGGNELVHIAGLVAQLHIGHGAAQLPDLFLCLAAAQSRMPEGALRLVVVTALSFSLFGAAAFAVVLSSDERSLLVGLIKKYLHRT